MNYYITWRNKKYSVSPTTALVAVVAMLGVFVSVVWGLYTISVWLLLAAVVLSTSVTTTDNKVHQLLPENLRRGVGYFSFALGLASTVYHLFII